MFLLSNNQSTNNTIQIIIENYSVAKSMNILQFDMQDVKRNFGKYQIKHCFILAVLEMTLYK